MSAFCLRSGRESGDFLARLLLVIMTRVRFPSPVPFDAGATEPYRQFAAFVLTLGHELAAIEVHVVVHTTCTHCIPILLRVGAGSGAGFKSDLRTAHRADFQIA